MQEHCVILYYVLIKWSEMDYKSSGVDIEAGNAFVERLKKKAPSIGGSME